METRQASEPDYGSLNPGDEVIRLVKPEVTKGQLVRYAGASGDFNPLHTDDETARAAGFPGVIAHGMLIMAFLTEAVTTWVPKKRLKKIKVRFKGMTRPGDVITVTARVKSKREVDGSGLAACAIEAADQDGDVKVTGTFEVVLPKEE